MEELLKLGALELARKIARKKVSPVEVVDAHINRIEEVNPKINAMVVERFEQARLEAKAAEDAVAAGAELGPLHGVPFTLKDTVALAGAPHTGGLYARKDHVASQDAVVVSRLRAAGAIPLGVTNVPELAMWYETYNMIYGRTRNPYGLDHIVGGSSGGEGALIGAGASPFGVGSDIGGSIRMPAFFCGIFGHKPTGGLVPMTGHYPRGGAKLGRVVTCGPMARRAKDLMPLLKIMAGPDGVDTSVIDLELGDPKEVDFKNRRVLVCHDLRARFSSGPNLEMRNAVDRAALALTAKGGEVIEWHSPRLKEAVLIWGSLLSDSDGPSFGELLGQGQPPSYGLELLRSLLGAPRHTLPALVFGLMESLTENLSDAKAREYIHLGVELRQELEQALGDDTILILPTHPRQAPRHDVPLRHPFDFIYTGIFNALELPATAVPMGLGPGRVPLGVQIVAGHGRDHLCIAAAMMLEKVVGGWAIPVRSLM